MLNKSSCFIDALELVYGLDAARIDREYQRIAPGSNPEVVGYHPQVVNLVLIREYQVCLSQFEPCPASSTHGLVTEEQLPLDFVLDFDCVVQGPCGPDGSEHALAFLDEKIIDPATGEEYVGLPVVRNAWQIVRYVPLYRGFRR